MIVTKRIASPDELKALRDKARIETDLRAGAKEMEIAVHLSTCGIGAGARDVLTELAEEIREGSIQNVSLKRAGCLGLCDQEPMVTLRDKSGREFRYGKLDKEKVHAIVQEHVLGGKPVREYFVKPKTGRESDTR